MEVVGEQQLSQVMQAAQHSIIQTKKCPSSELVVCLGIYFRERIIRCKWRHNNNLKKTETASDDMGDGSVKEGREGAVVYTIAPLFTHMTAM